MAMSLLNSFSLSPCLSHNTENAQGSPLYILPLPNNRVMKLYIIYNILHISFHNIFIEKEKYNEQQLCRAITKFI